MLIHTASIAVVASFASCSLAQTFFGPTPYLCASDSPWNTAAPGFTLETFEDGALVAGVTTNATVINPSGITDSVDCDSGPIDGSGTSGRSAFGGGGIGVTFTFSPPYPHRVGLVWTDGNDTIRFEAFAPDGTRLGERSGDHDNTSYGGQTDEDRFYGVEFAGGIQRVRMWQTGGGAGAGIEVDHLQFGPIAPGCDSIDFNNNAVFPEDQDVIDFFTVLAGGPCSPGNTCSDIDFNNNAVFPEDQDIIDFFNVLAGAEC
jgi:hypothetical protein